MPPRRPSRPKLKQQTLLGFLSSSPPSSPSSLFPKSPSPIKRKRAHETSSSSSSSDDEAPSADSDVNAIDFEPERADISEEDCSPRRPRKRRSLAGAHTIPSRASSDESLDAPIAAPRHRKGKHKVVLDSDDDTQRRKRKLIKGVRPPTPEEDDDILDSDNQVLETRLRSRGKMTAYQKNLEKFKMSKGKKRSETLVLQSSSEGEQSNNSEVPFKGAKPHYSRGGDSDASRAETDASDEDDDDGFIVEDDAKGVPTMRLPPAFSLSTHQDLAHHFKIICQLFVHLAVRPLADRRPFFQHALKEEYLAVPLQVTRRKLCGMRDSLVASSVWNSDFKKSLERYPKFTLVRLDSAVPQCDACHLGGRVSTLLGRLSGKPYDMYDFEDVSDGESDESSEDGDGDEDSDGVRRRDVREAFHLGRFCAARTQVYHQFSHWEHSLYKSLQWEITRVQDDTREFVKVAYSGGVRPPRDLHDADKVMEWLDARRIIDMEWQKVRQMMDSSRKLERGEVDEVDFS